MKQVQDSKRKALDKKAISHIQKNEAVVTDAITTDMHKRERPAVPQKPHPQVLSKGDLQKPTIYSDKKPPIAAKSKITNN